MSFSKVSRSAALWVAVRLPTCGRPFGSLCGFLYVRAARGRSVKQSASPELSSCTDSRMRSLCAAGTRWLKMAGYWQEPTRSRTEARSRSGRQARGPRIELRERNRNKNNYATWKAAGVGGSQSLDERLQPAAAPAVERLRGPPK